MLSRKISYSKTIYKAPVKGKALCLGGLKLYVMMYLIFKDVSVEVSDKRHDHMKDYIELWIC